MAPHCAGMSRELQASLQQHPGVACVYGICRHVAKLCQAVVGRCSALFEAAEKNKKQKKHSIIGGARERAPLIQCSEANQNHESTLVVKRSRCSRHMG